MMVPGTPVGALPGFWLPRSVREQLLTPEIAWESVAFSEGRECGKECAADDPDAVAVSWPRLSAAEWGRALDILSRNRARAPRGPELWSRLQSALHSVAVRQTRGNASGYHAVLSALSSYTGYSPQMIGVALHSRALWQVDDMAKAFQFRPTWEAARQWAPLAGLPGLLRFYPSGRLASARHRYALGAKAPLFGSERPPETVVGFAAGNVPGAALLIVLLALATAISGGGSPAVLVRNSRREPIFSPLVLSMLEEEDEDLVSSVALLIWDYDDLQLQRVVLSGADLVVAAAGDDTIGRISKDIALCGGAARFHAHGHKVSFTTIGKKYLTGSREQLGISGIDDLEGVALLAALDTAMWDQNGCLSSRVHFVERGGAPDDEPQAYAEALTRRMRMLAAGLPRGRWPRNRLHDSFDSYKAMESWGPIRVLSDYDDDFVVILDGRHPAADESGARAFAAQVNDCQGRVVVVRLVDDLLEVPELYLRHLPRGMLQSMSVAIGISDQPPNRRFLEFASACGREGVTAIRSAGRAAFPQLAYSWDGYLPLDLVRRRPAGHFTTIEFDDCAESMRSTYQELDKLLRPPRPGERHQSVADPGSSTDGSS